jgi:hypothetical protein
LKCHLGLLPNKREGILVIEFWSPAMWSIVIGQAFCILNRNARTRMGCSATRLERQAMHCTQVTVGLLLLKRATLFSAREPQTCSIISHRMTRPESSRSEFVIVPFGFDSDFTLAVMSGGHCCRNTVGGHSKSLPMMMPPTPWLEASATPTKSNQPMTSLQQRVRQLVDSRRIVQQLDIAK